MRQPVSSTNRTPMRAHLELGARAGIASAIARLRPPPFPDALVYLWAWFLELDSTRGMDMNGPSGFTYPMIDAWARLTRRTIAPHELQALFLLDAVTRFPDPPAAVA
jgi:hypothetical protein